MKAAIVIDETLPVGLKANAAAVLGVSLGALHPEIVGPDLVDGGGGRHPGITGLPIPILSAPSDRLSQIVGRDDDDEASLTIVGFSDVAQRCTSYDDYGNQLAATDKDDIRYLAVLVVGSNRSVNRVTGSLPLVR